MPDRSWLSKASEGPAGSPFSGGGTAASGGAGVLLEELDGVADGLEVLDLVVGDAHAELLLGRHDDLDAFRPGSLIVDGLARTDAADGDNASFANGTVTVQFGNVTAPATRTIEFRALVN